MSTTVTLDDDIAARLEELRAARGATFDEIVNDILRRGLARIRSDRSSQGRYEMPVADMGRCLIGDFESVSDALALVEGEDFR